jgi:hypothetical protein
MMLSSDLRTRARLRRVSRSATAQRRRFDCRGANRALRQRPPSRPRQPTATCWMPLTRQLGEGPAALGNEQSTAQRVQRPPFVSAGVVKHLKANTGTEIDR